MKYLGGIYSLENLKNEWIVKFEELVGEKITFITKNEIKIPIISEKIKVLITRDRDITESMIKNMPKLEMLCVLSAGVERLPFDIIRDRNIIVISTSGISNESMSDYVIGNMINYTSKLQTSILNQKERYWQKFLYTDTLCGKELLIVGAGKIGTAIARKAQAFDMKIIGIRNNPEKSEYFKEILDVNKLDYCLKTADFVVCVLPLTEETVHIFNYDKFKMMKKTAIFMNISRGQLIIQKDLIRALQEEILGGAVLDVFDPEPLERDSELWEMKNVIITPHSSGRIENYLEAAIRVLGENILAYKEDKKLPNLIDLTKQY